MSAYPLDIVFCVPGLPFNGDTLKNGSLGGSESAGLYLARALAKRGHRVKMFCNTPEQKTYDGVEYRSISTWQHFAQAAPHDVMIGQRAPEMFDKRLSSKLNVLWCHDLALKRTANNHKAVSWNVDKVALLSQFMVDQYKQVVGLPDDMIFKTRNGFDFEAQPLPIKPWAQRDQKLILYAARPERGLDVLVRKVFPAMLERDPLLKLAICTYANPNELEQSEWHQALMRDIVANPSIVQLGALTKAQLYDVMNTAALYLYPTPGEASPEFREVSCIAALEAQACGLPFISTGHGALRETTAASPPMALRTMPSHWFEDDVCITEFVSCAMHFLTSEASWDKAQRDQFGHLKTGRYSWDEIAEDWEFMFHEEIAKRNDDPVRLASWFYKRSEIEGAERALEKAPTFDILANRLRDEIAEKYAFRKSEAALAAHYAKMGEGTDADLTAKDAAGMFSKEFITNNPEPRFQILKSIIAELKGEIKSVLDLGCGHGWSPIFLHNNLDLSVYGLDVAPDAIKWANHWRDRFANDPTRCHFTSDPHLAFKAWPEHMSGGYDALVCSEVLEHVIDPYTFLQNAERAVRPGGWVFITVPFGPWEYDGPNWHGLRAHIREFSSADLHEIFGDKPGFGCGGILNTYSPQLSDPLGFYVVKYQADHKPLNRINWDRKLKIQRPKETLSVNIIAGPGAEQTLRWCLDGIKHIADEIVIGDTGLNEAGLAAAQDHGARVVPAPKPLQEGFDAARNSALDASTCDWVLWIDSDERLTDAQAINQFLRRNQFAGYTINQHHLTVDAPIPTDTPVRLFRRGPNKDGETIRFRGFIHEHPETGENKGPGVVCILSPIHIAHLGYTHNNQRMGRFYRNRPLLIEDRKRNPDRVLGMFLEARDNQTLMQAELGRTGGRVTEQAKEIARKTIALCRQFWDSKVPLVNIDPMPFYTDALRVLGDGFDAYVDIKIGRDGVGDRIEGGYRFANPDEFKAFVERQTKDKLDAVSGQWF